MYNKSSDSLLLIIICILFIISLDFTTADDYNRLVFDEKDSSIWIYEVATYRDGTTVVLLNRNLSDTCVEPILHMRVVHPDGGMTSSDISTSIPGFNFCLGNYGRRNPSSYGLRFYPSVDGILLVTYLNSSDITRNPSIYGLTISLDGNILWNNYIGAGYVNNSTLMYPDKIETSKFNPQTGIFYSEMITGSEKVEWFFYDAPDPQGKFSLVNSGKISLPPSFNDDAYLSPFHTIDGGYGIVMADINNSSTGGTQLWMYAIFVQPVTGTASDPHLVYNGSMPSSLDIDDISCAVDYNSQGQVCFVVVTESQNDVTSRYGLEISFLLSGSTNSSWELNVANAIYTYMEPLFSGGYLFVTQDDSGVINGYLSDDQGKNVTWGLPSLTVETAGRKYGVFQNNTVVAVVRDYATSSAWDVISAELSNFTNNDHGYNNPNVLSTSPSIHGVTSVGTNLISIQFNIPVQLSVNNVSIYMKNDTNTNSSDILRETYSGQSMYCYLDKSDNGILMLKTLDSTFNRPGASYYVVLDDNFAISANSRLPMIGVPQYLWNFQTVSTADPYSDQSDRTTGLVRLTPSGTTYFRNLTSQGRSDFLLKLRDQLSTITPVKSNQLSPSGKYQMTIETTGLQTLLSFEILPGSDATDPSIPRVVQDLDTLIRNKWITAISRNNYTSMLDENFGFQETSHPWETYKLQLIAFGAILTILTLIFVQVQIKYYQKGNNLLILRIALFIFDFVIDLVFLLKNGRVIDNLWIPTLIFFIVPKVTNVFLSALIVHREFYKNSLFYSWFTEFPRVLMIIVPLSPIRIECLKIINSRIARFEILNAPLSSKAESMIFWSTVFIFFIEDIPQLIIQILYLISTIQYDIIPLLALASCIITMLQTITMVLYRTIRNKKQSCHMEKLRDDDNSISSTLHPSDGSAKTMSDLKLFEKPSVSKFNHEMMESESDTCVSEHMSESDGMLLRYGSKVLRRGGSCNDFERHPCEIQGMIIQPRPKSWNDIVEGNNVEDDDEAIIIKENASIKKVSVIESNESVHNEQKGIVITVGNYGELVIPEADESAMPE